MVILLMFFVKEVWYSIFCTEPYVQYTASSMVDVKNLGWLSAQVFNIKFTGFRFIHHVNPGR